MLSQLTRQSPGRWQALGLVLHCLSLWPVVTWAIRRFRDGSDEPWGLLALGTLLVVLVVRARRMPSRSPGFEGQDLWLPVFALAVYGLSLHWLSPLPTAVIGLLSVALSLSRVFYRERLQLGVLALCWLSIPLLASLDFYLGYPLRVVTAELAKFLLQFGGLGVARRGVSLFFAGGEVSVDPACSGIRMLWGSAYVTAVLACVTPLAPKKSLLAVTVVTFLLLCGNAWRSAALFYVESGRIALPSFAHQGLGVVVFALMLSAILGTWYCLSRHSDRVASSVPEVGYQRGSISGRGLVLVALGALGTSLVPAAGQTTKAGSDFPGWPKQFEGEPLTSEALSPEESRFYQQFPGRTAAFRTPERRLLVRWLSDYTRKLHPAVQCYRGSGYQVEHSRQCVRANGLRYGCFEATDGRRRLLVSERIEDASGRSWTDVSSWYWAAVLGQTSGPWVSTTVVESRGAVTGEATVRMPWL